VAGPVVETETEVAHGWRTTRTTRTTRDETVTVQPDGSRRTESTTRVEQTEDAVPVAYQGPVSGHPKPVG
jgi:hypothetical protein